MVDLLCISLPPAIVPGPRVAPITTSSLAPGPRLWDLEPDTGPTSVTCDRQATHTPQATCPGGA
jgi:hypothetical protein